jgi:hypothetical protein
VTLTAPSARPARGPLRRVGTVVVGLVVVVAAAVLLLPDRLGIGDRLPFVMLVILRPAATVVLGLLALAVLVVRRRWWPTALGVLLVVALAATAMAPRLVGGADAEPAPAGSPGFTLLSANVYDGSADVPAFAALLRERRPDVGDAGAALEAWMAAARGGPLNGFVRGLERDVDAVIAAIATPWSTGPVEGQITRLKAIQRSMYGRAGFRLLRQRVLLAA